MEFDDGKFMLGKMDGLQADTWEALQEVVGVERLNAAFTDSDLAATINWTMTPLLQDIWDGLIGLLEPREDGTKPILFIDLCDPGKRQPEDLLRALEPMREFERF